MQCRILKSRYPQNFVGKTVCNIHFYEEREPNSSQVSRQMPVPSCTSTILLLRSGWCRTPRSLWRETICHLHDKGHNQEYVSGKCPFAAISVLHSAPVCLNAKIRFLLVTVENLLRVSRSWNPIQCGFQEISGKKSTLRSYLQHIGWSIPDDSPGNGIQQQASSVMARCCRSESSSSSKKSWQLWLSLQIVVTIRQETGSSTGLHLHDWMSCFANNSWELTTRKQQIMSSLHRKREIDLCSHCAIHSNLWSYKNEWLPNIYLSCTWNIVSMFWRYLTNCVSRRYSSNFQHHWCIVLFVT